MSVNAYQAYRMVFAIAAADFPLLAILKKARAIAGSLHLRAELGMLLRKLISPHFQAFRSATLMTRPIRTVEISTGGPNGAKTGRSGWPSNKHQARHQPPHTELQQTSTPSTQPPNHPAPLLTQDVLFLTESLITARQRASWR